MWFPQQLALLYMPLGACKTPALIVLRLSVVFENSPSPLCSGFYNLCLSLMCWSIKQCGWHHMASFFLLVRRNMRSRLPTCHQECWCRWGQRNTLWIWNRKRWCLWCLAVESELLKQLGLLAPRVWLHKGFLQQQSWFKKFWLLGLHPAWKTGLPTSAVISLTVQLHNQMRWHNGEVMKHGSLISFCCQRKHWSST